GAEHLRHPVQPAARHSGGERARRPPGPAQGDRQRPEGHESGSQGGARDDQRAAGAGGAGARRTVRENRRSRRTPEKRGTYPRIPGYVPPKTGVEQYEGRTIRRSSSSSSRARGSCGAASTEDTLGRRREEDSQNQKPGSRRETQH